MKDPPLGKRTDFNVGIQIVGRPDDCIQQPDELQRLTGTDLVCGFSYGRMLPDKAGLNTRLFAERVEREAARRRVCGGVGASKCHIVVVPACSCSIRTHGSTQAVWPRKLTVIAKRRTLNKENWQQNRIRVWNAISILDANGNSLCLWGFPRCGTGSWQGGDIIISARQR
jgi:hypothetical protein